MASPQLGQFMKLSNGHVVNVIPHHGDKDGVIALVEGSYLDPWDHPKSDQVDWRLVGPIGAKTGSYRTKPGVETILDPAGCRQGWNRRLP